MIEKSYANLNNVIYVSMVQMLYQSIANSMMGIMSQITSQNQIWWAGPVTTIILFVFSGLGSLYNGYIGKYKYRYTFFIGSLGYIVYNASAIVFVSIDHSNTMSIVVGTFLVNIVGGLVVSMLYISQFNYISDCSIADDRSMYFGINMGIVQSANIFGNLLSAYTVEPLGQKWYCIAMTILIAALSVMFLFVRRVEKK